MDVSLLFVSHYLNLLSHIVVWWLFERGGILVVIGAVELLMFGNAWNLKWRAGDIALPHHLLELLLMSSSVDRCACLLSISGAATSHVVRGGIALLDRFFDSA